MKELSRLFKITYPSTLIYAEMTPCETGINFVSSQGKNNGIVGRVKKREDVTEYPAGIITVPLKGTVLQAYVQSEPCYVAHQIAVLEPLEPMSLNEKLYYCMCIRQNKFRYNYGRQADSSLSELLLPERNDFPDWIINEFAIQPENYIKAFSETTVPALNTASWKYFSVEKIFDEILSGCSTCATELPIGDDLWYIAAMKRDNGAMKRVAFVEGMISKGNCIALIQNGQGSAGYANYIGEDFIGTKDISLGYSKNLNKFNGLFLACVFGIEKYRYSFGRKWNGNRLKQSKVKLPALKNAGGIVITDKDGEYIIDWGFMENYVKALPYSSHI